MKINEKYDIKIVVIKIENGIPADCYDNFEEFKKENPHSSYRFGYIVFDNESGYVPESCNDWNDSPEEALFDYQDNCL